MAGLGYKSFSAGSVLTAVDLQGYTVDQTVMKFASASARTTALASPSQGMVSYLTDSGTTWQYYALYNASTNPGGAKTAGWYPIAGAVFYGTATRSAATGTSYAPGASGFSYTELADTLAWHDPTTNPDRIIPKSEGIYRVTASAQFAASASGGRNGQIQKNGQDFISFYGTGVTVRNFSMSGVAYMNGTTDYFNAAAYSQDSGGSLTIITQVSVEYIRPSIV
jgi:hypothetical protein